MSVIEVRPDHGGNDAEDFAASLAESLHKSLIRSGYTVNKEPFSRVQRAFVLSTNAPLDALRWLEGVHTIQRIPKGSAARHTSSATVVVRDKVKVNTVDINLDEVRIDRYRGHGKGGQNRNKVSTAVRVVHHPTGIIITRESGRSQDANLESALAQLKEELQAREHDKAHAQLTDARSVLDNGAKSFTHNTQRGEVVHHATGKRWSIKAWNAGRVEIG